MYVKPNTVLAITGPTASGKTALALEIASINGIDAEIISADSRQIFTCLDIGTAKPTREEMAQIPHHCIDICEPEDSFNAGAFASKAGPIIDALLSNHVLPIIVGGSGLYVQALCEGFFEEPESLRNAFASARKEVQSLYEQLGKDALFEHLKSIDPQSCLDYSDKNPRRIMRALEFYLATGLQFSSEKRRMMHIPTFQTTYVMINHERDALYQRINARCDEIWEGTKQEAKFMMERGVSRNAQSMDTVGYSQALSYLFGEISEESAINMMKQATRNYAKRQLTWSKRIKDMHILKGNLKEMAVEALSLIRESP